MQGVVHAHGEIGAGITIAVERSTEGLFEEKLSVRAGAHCCGVYELFIRDPGTGWKHLGDFGIENGGPSPASQVLFEQDDRVWIGAMDNSYDYFHSSHVGSLLANAFPEYVEVTSGGYGGNGQPSETSTSRVRQRQPAKSRRKPRTALRNPP